jgi:hypothetical protein
MSGSVAEPTVSSKVFAVSWVIEPAMDACSLLASPSLVLWRERSGRWILVSGGDVLWPPQ